LAHGSCPEGFGRSKLYFCQELQIAEKSKIEASFRLSFSMYQRGFSLIFSPEDLGEDNFIFFKNLVAGKVCSWRTKNPNQRKSVWNLAQDPNW